MTLEQKIRNAIPELIELGLECEIKSEKGLIYKIIDETTTRYYALNKFSQSVEFSHYDIITNYEIIGKPIQLNHVLEYFFEILGIFNEDILKELYFLWNLKSNLLSDQSPELKNFINQLA